VVPRSPLHAAVGQAIVVARDKRDVTQEDLALEADVSRHHLSAIERGKANPTLAMLDKLARALGVTVRSLIPADADPE
jgi:transcriptional regulator with XRE-family HTH domain